MKKTAILFLLFLFIITANSQWNSDVTINTEVCTASFKQKEIRITSDSDGGAFVVWRDYRTGTFFEESDIYIQKIDSNGYTEWTIDGLGLCMLPSNQGTPSVINDEKGGVIVAWTDRRTGGEDIYAQRIDEFGNVLWAQNGIVVCNKSNREHSAKIISDDHSGLIAVWEDMRADSTFNIWAQRIDSSGINVWANGGVNLCLQDSNRINHKVQRNRDGGAIVTWQDRRAHGANSYDIYVQNIDSNGVLLWGNSGKSICNASNNQTNPKIDPEKGADGVFVSWVDKRNNVDYDIYCNRIDSNGNFMWGSAGKPVVVYQGNQSALDILSNNKTNGIIVTWKDKRGDTLDIYAQKLDLNGNREWQTNGVVVCNAIEEQKNPNIISDKNGGAIITWEDERNGDWDIYAQRISYNGNAIWQNNGEPICLAIENQSSAKNIPDNKGGTIIAWEDKRGGISKDIFIHHLLIEDTVTYIKDTTVIIPVDTVLEITNSLGLDLNVYPNPFDNQLVIDVNDAEEYTYSLIDVLGKEIKNMDLNYSKNQIEIDFSNQQLVKGLYFLIIENEKGIHAEMINKQ